MLARVAAEAARRFADATAYATPSGSTVSYRDLDRRSDEAAVGLARRGLGEGDVVALVLPTCVEHVVAYLAAAKVGAVTAGVNTRLSPPEQDAVLGTADPALVLRDPAEVDELAVAGEAPPPLPEDPDRPVAMVFTSGTTGTPKPAVFCGRQLDFITGVDTGWRWGTGGATLAGTSLAHLGPTTKLPGKLVAGGVTHLMERWRPADALRLVAGHRMATLGGIPTQVALMLRDPAFSEVDLSCVKAVVMGGGPATAALVREVRERLGVPVLIRYSCTEAGVGTGTTAADPPEDAEVSVGRPLPGVEVRVDGDGEGEVCLRSPAVAEGYDWVRTGDLGWVDDQGRLRLVGRAKEMYVRGGYNVYPAEVEDVLASHPAVADVAVVPRPDDVMGEVGVAVVVPRDPGRPPGLEELREAAAGQLAAYKLPEALVVTEALPLTSMEKVDRRALLALVTQEA